MKNTQTIARLLLATTALTVLAQNGRAEVQMNVGGKHLPAKGTVRVLVVFAQFKDDLEDPTNYGWPSGQLPSWSDQLFASEQAASYAAWTVSDYYWQMSNGTYHVLGDIYPKLVVTTLNSDQYAQFKMTFSDINKEILSKVDPEIDFTRYDRWNISKVNNRV